MVLTESGNLMGITVEQDLELSIHLKFVYIKMKYSSNFVVFKNKSRDTIGKLDVFI